MTRGFLPNTDAGLLAWSLNFSSLISSAPASYGLSAEAAAQYAAAHAAYAGTLAACDPAVRCKVSTAAKNAARDMLKLAARRIASLIQGQAAVSDARKIALGLTVRSSPTPIPPPSAAPRLNIVAVSGWTVKFKLRDSTSSASRGLPPSVSGASLFSFVGAQPPSDLSAWRFECSTGRSTVELQFGINNPPGTTVWLTAFWFNGRKQSGPMCPPVSTNLPGGSVSMAA